MNSFNQPLRSAGAWVDVEAGTASRAIFSDEEIWRLEQEKVFAKSWLFLAHETEIPEPGDHVTRQLGNDPVLVVRGEDGRIRAFHNSCVHRGTKLCRTDAGNSKTFTCPYHGWVYGLDGKLQATVYPPEVAAKIGESTSSLIEMAQVDSYAGLVFGTWDETAPSLDQYLGDSRFYIDLFANRTQGGMEVLGPPQRWVFKANWKLGALNFAADGPHAASVHGPITYLTLQVPPEQILQQLINSPAVVIGEGHNCIFLEYPEEAPDYAGFSPALVPLYQQQLNQAQQRMLARGLTKVMTNFPNTSWVESSVTFDDKTPPIPFCNLRTWQPLSAQSTEVWNWLLVEKEAAEEFKQQSYEIGIRTFAAGGTFDQDDAEAWSAINLGCRGSIGSRYEVDFRATKHYRDEPIENFPGPGVAYPSTFSEMSEFALLAHWQKVMSAGSDC
jgi:phenylpropionate dioxygenase-like ring-hydroxylating dioxygenase large terminal subunit